MEITWDEAEVAAQNISEWCRSVAQCIHLDAGWIKVKVKFNVKKSIQILYRSAKMMHSIGKFSYRMWPLITTIIAITIIIIW